MENSFKISINAPREKVWDILWDENTYPEWTSVFCEGSHAVTDWQEGSKVLFIDPKRSGMVSEIAKKVPNEFMSFKVLGEVTEGVEDYDSPNARAMAGALENYTLTADGDKTLLTVEFPVSDMPDEMKEYFLNVWPKAMESIKTLAEDR